MYAVVSLLDEQHTKAVEDIWAELRREFGLQAVYEAPFPHVSYQSAEQYDAEVLMPIVQRLAQTTPAFRVRTRGLGIFTGLLPTLYIPVVRAPGLSRLQRTLWDDLTPTAFGVSAHYHPDTWMPHITLALRDTGGETAHAVGRLLAERDVDWDIGLDNLALIGDTGARHELIARFPLGGDSAPSERADRPDRTSIHAKRRRGRGAPFH